MAPIPRCDLRLPDEGGRRSSQSTGGSISGPKQGRSGSGHPLHNQRPKTRDSAEMLEEARQFSTGLTRDFVEIMEHKQHEGVGLPTIEDTDEEEDEPITDAGGSGRPFYDQQSTTRDSAEILEDADEFSTGLTRDAVEVFQHKRHERGGGSGEFQEDACTVLRRCRAEIEEQEAAAAAAVIDEEDVIAATAAPRIATVATPGDVCSRFCKNRAESPFAEYSLKKAIAGGYAYSRRKSAMKCKGTYASTETYKYLWGSSKAVSARKTLELEMRKKRKYYELLHERNRRRRENERRRAKEKRRMLRCKDQSKIAETSEYISINKAFYFRFNYNRQLPFMPSSMDEHLKKYKKPPFKHFHKGSRPCRKHVDEFEKLRVTKTKNARGMLIRPPIKAKA